MKRVIFSVLMMAGTMTAFAQAGMETTIQNQETGTKMTVAVENPAVHVVPGESVQVIANGLEIIVVTGKGEYVGKAKETKSTKADEEKKKFGDYHFRITIDG